MKTNNYTFWELLNLYRVEIPIIQRDYAQGRNNGKTKVLRKTFVKELKTSLEEGNAMHLNFVYGKLNGIANEIKQKANKSALLDMVEAIRMYSINLELNIDVICTENNLQVKNGVSLKTISFVPLDGQQRLTTLFLLHWYILTRIINTEGKKQLTEDKKRLNNFSYLIRPSSKNFCEAFVNENLSLTKDTYRISEEIKDAIWFHLHWKKDPTVTGMLNMLDEIHNQFREVEDLGAYWSALTENRKVNFDFLNLDDYNLTDNLYVKMNARGLTLTPFENFKSWLIEYVEDKEDDFKIDVKNWKRNFDKDWADLFWDNKDDGNYLIDEEYMRFIRNMAQIFYVRDNEIKDLKTATNPEEKAKRENVILLATTKYKEGEFKDEYIYIPNDLLIELNIFSDRNLNEMFEIMSLLAKPSNCRIYNSKALKEINLTSEKSFFKAFITGQMSYSDKAMFYALASFLIINKDFTESSEDKLISWMRIMRNLILNSTIDDRANFSRAIKGIDLLAEKCNEIIDHVAGYSSDNFYGFSEYQSKEEIEKAKVIKSDFEFEKLFLKYENHKLFRGSISFVLKTSKEETGIKMLNDYLPVIYELFKDDGSNYEYLLIRAILTNCSINEDVKFLNNANSWREILKKEVIQDGLIKTIELIDHLPDIDATKKHVENILITLTSTYEDKSILWRYYLIKNSVLLNTNASYSKYIKKSDDNFYLFNNENANWNNNDNQFLLSNLRNELISEVINQGIFELYHHHEWWNNRGFWVKKDEITGTNFYRGKTIYLRMELNGYYFWLQFTPDKLYMGIRIIDNERIELLENPFESNGFWIIYTSHSYTHNTDNIQDWTNELMNKYHAINSVVKSKNEININNGVQIVAVV